MLSDLPCAPHGLKRESCSLFPSPVIFSHLLQAVWLVTHHCSEEGLMRIILKSIKSNGGYRAAFERQAIDLWSLLENTSQGTRQERRKDAHVDQESVGCMKPLGVMLTRCEGTSPWFMMCTDDGARTIQRVINILVINRKKWAACQGNLSGKAEDQLSSPRATQ